MGDLSQPSWRTTAKKAFAESNADGCTDLAAALTYYSVLALFPALLALVSLLGIFGQGESTTAALLDMVRDLGQNSTADQLEGPITQMTQANRAGFALVAGVAGALWSASGYVGAFGRALNRVYEVDEGRPFWKLRPLQLLLTLVGIIMLGLVLLGLVVSGPVAQAVGDAVGLGSTAVTIWNIAKWPVILVVVIVLVAMLYYSTPNVKPGFRWSRRCGIAIVVWIIASLLFGLYVATSVPTQDLRVAGRCDRLPPVAVDHQPGPASAPRSRRARAIAPAAGGDQGRGDAPAAASRRHGLEERCARRRSASPRAASSARRRRRTGAGR